MWTQVQQLTSKALSSRFLRSAGTISGGAAIAQLIAFAASPILTRLYSPSAYGALALMLAFITMGVTMASLHYELAIALPKRDEDAASITLLAILLGTVSSAVSVFLFAPAGANLLGRWGFDEIIAFWWLLPVTLLATAIYQALQLWHLRRQRYKEVAANGVVQSVTQNGLPIALAALGFSGIGLLLGLAVSRVVAAVGFLSRAVRRDRTILVDSLKRLRALAAEYKSFPTIGLAGAVLHMACFHLPIFLLTDLYGAGIAGLYMLQDRVLGVPLAVMAQGLASVFYVNAAKLAHEDPAALKRSYFKLLRTLTLSGLAPTVILILIAPWLFKIVFGARWEIAGEYARIMAVPTLLRFVGGPLYRCLTILKKQSWILVWDGIGVILMLTLPLYLGGGAMGVGGIQSVAIAISVTYAGLLFSATWAVIRHAHDSRAAAPATVAKEPLIQNS